jgi:hypothetical protein
METGDVDGLRLKFCSITKISCHALNFVSESYTSDSIQVYFAINHIMLSVHSWSPPGENIVFYCLHYNLPFVQLLASKLDCQFFDTQFLLEVSMTYCTCAISAIKILIICGGLMVPYHISWSCANLNNCLTAILSHTCNR